MKRVLLLFILASVFSVLQPLVAADRFAYPPALKSDQVDEYFGRKMPDPARELENADSEPTKKWIAAENEVISAI